MKILSIETSTEYCSVALLIDGKLDERETRAGQKHSDLLLPMIDDVLVSNALKLRDLDGIAFGEGPGSFTGLRIACGVVQGLAFGADLRVVGVGTLLAMAHGSGAERVVCCVDARVKECYHAAYEKNADGWKTIHAPSVRAPADVPELIGGNWLACGNGFSVYGDVLVQRYSGQLAAIDAEAVPHARDIARLAMPAFESGETLPPDQAAPVYLRDKVALRIDERPNR